MESSFSNIINQAKSILILLPTDPLLDDVASGLALFLALSDKTQVQIYSPKPMTVEFNWLVGVNKITSELGNKNLIIRFVDYKATDIERVNYDIEDGQFKLSVIPKQGILPPKKEQVELTYSGISADFVIVIGGLSESQFPALSSKDLASANVVHIGTKDISFSSIKSYISFSRPASSVSEIVAGLIKESGLSLNEDIATNLLMGIEEATSNFADASVTADTFEVASMLMRAGGKRSTGRAFAPEGFPQGSIPGIPAKAFVSQSKAQASPRLKVQPRPQEQNQEEKQEEAPSDWLRPKIYKGTSIS